MTDYGTFANIEKSRLQINAVLMASHNRLIRDHGVDAKALNVVEFTFSASRIIEAKYVYAKWVADPNNGQYDCDGQYGLRIRALLDAGGFCA